MCSQTGENVSIQTPFVRHAWYLSVNNRNGGHDVATIICADRIVRWFTGRECARNPALDDKRLPTPRRANHENIGHAMRLGMSVHVIEPIKDRGYVRVRNPDRIMNGRQPSRERLRSFAASIQRFAITSAGTS